MIFDAKAKRDALIRKAKEMHDAKHPTKVHAPKVNKHRVVRKPAEPDRLARKSLKGVHRGKALD